MTEMKAALRVNRKKIKICYNRPMKFITYHPEGLKGSTAFSKNPHLYLRQVQVSGRFV